MQTTGFLGPLAEMGVLPDGSRTPIGEGQVQVQKRLLSRGIVLCRSKRYKNDGARNRLAVCYRDCCSQSKNAGGGPSGTMRERRSFGP